MTTLVETILMASMIAGVALAMTALVVFGVRLMVDSHKCLGAAMIVLYVAVCIMLIGIGVYRAIASDRAAAQQVEEKSESIDAAEDAS